MEFRSRRGISLEQHTQVLCLGVGCRQGTQVQGLHDHDRGTLPSLPLPSLLLPLPSLPYRRGQALTALGLSRAEFQLRKVPPLQPCPG